VNRGTVLRSLGIFAVLVFIGRTLLLNQFNSLKQEVNSGLKEELKEGIRKEVINIEKDTVAKLKNDIEGIGKKTFAKLKNNIGDIGKDTVVKLKNDIEDISKEAVAKLNFNIKNNIGDIGKESVAKFKNDIEDIAKEAVAKLKNGENLQNEVENWAKSIRGRKVFSQNDEDGAIEEVFRKIGTTDKVYVEFGVEDGEECNTHYLRESLGWDVKNSLLMDGGHERPEINLKKVIFWPDNIVDLFERFGVKKNFDFLSEDSDSYDFFMTEAILEAGFSPRVIMMEYNANFQLDEARSIIPPAKGESWLRWDWTTYQGCSLLALKLLLERFKYSVVWCNKVNCLAVKDSELGTSLRLPLEVLDNGRLDQHRCDDKNRPLAIIDEDGRWSGKSDGGKGSPHIRCQKQQTVL